MPAIKPRVQVNGPVPAHPPDLSGDILACGVQATNLTTDRITAAIYGRNRVGKTTFACQGSGPIALISIEPSPTGGARSVTDRSDITVYQVAAKYLPVLDRNGNPTGQLESVKGSQKVLAIADALKTRFARGERPFKKVVIDGVTSWNDVILAEILGVDWENVPSILGLGEVSGDQYKDRSGKLMRYLKPFFDLPCDIWVVAQEKDHNPPKEKTITRGGKEYTRPTQTALMREAHPMAQEGSFFSLAVGDAQAKFIQDNCDFVMQMYEDAELREVHTPDVVVNGEVIKQPSQLIATGRRVKRLRCIYHPNYAAGFRAPGLVPEYIEAATPQERYQAFLDVAAGRRTKFGRYPDQGG